jgi:hypothetical protein
VVAVVGRGRGRGGDRGGGGGARSCLHCALRMTEFFEVLVMLDWTTDVVSLLLLVLPSLQKLSLHGEQKLGSFIEALQNAYLINTCTC